MRRLLPLLVVLLLPGDASAAGLGGVTTLDAPAPAYADLALATPTRAYVYRDQRYDRGLRMQMSGAGELKGFLLLRWPVAGRPAGISYLDGGGGFTMTPLNLERGGDEDNAWYTLPAGDYRLYALADASAPVSLRVEFPTLPGQVALQPAAALGDARSRDLERRDSVGEQAVVFGGIEALAGQGLWVTELGAFGDSVADQIQSCAYPPGTDPDATDAFSLDCPGGEASAPFVALTPGLSALQSLMLDAKPGRWGLGGNIQAAAPTKQTYARGLWTPYEGTPLQAPEAAQAEPAPAPLTIQLHGIRSRGRRLLVRAGCGSRPCAGTATVTAAGRRLGSARFRAPAGRLTAVRIRLRRAPRRAQLNVQVRDGAAAAFAVRRLRLP